MADEQELRELADTLHGLYEALDAAKFAQAPQTERVMRPRPGPRTPGNWLMISLDAHHTGMLFEMCRDAANYVAPQTILHHQGRKLCEWIKWHSHYIATDFPAADDLADLMRDQVRTLDRRLAPKDAGQVANEDPYLTADSIQRNLTAKGLECPEATIRSWAARGHVSTKTRRDGHRAYRLGDIIRRLVGEDPYDQDKENPDD
ncbi:hypothetical protein NYP18_09080 [Corynebacterium sp. YIM 101645]|uniref:Uncharacterized protein n=1 Tax=Corynebacterium lemuris TaxID=1859292 RepID=A0ABT2G0J4_9CORY|nr:hypothetical protein [Corynebacterium lemuris]MCS5479812.1 hypothetical protein [Corynebacterium lemuris]